MAGLKDIERALIRAIVKVKYKNLKRYGEIASDMIRLRTRLGYGVAADGEPKVKLRRLTDNTVLLRSKKKLSEFTAPAKSNLTETGQMLDSIGVVSTSNQVVTIGPRGVRDDGQTNKEVADKAERLGRPYLYLSNVEKKRLSDEFKKDLIEEVQSELTKL